MDALEGDSRIRAVEPLSIALGAARDALARAYVLLAGGRMKKSNDDRQRSVETRISKETRDGIGIITMRDEAKRNALSARTADDIIAALDWCATQDVRAVVLRSAPGAAVWSSGHAVDELPKGCRDPLAYNDPLEQCVRAVRSLRQPVLAMVHGSVWGGAFDLVFSCDLVIADETATFAITPANLGLPYNTTGLLRFLGRIPVNIVKEMFFIATPIDAPHAERWMVINHLVAATELESFTVGLTGIIASKAPLAITAVKEQLKVLSDYQLIAAQVYERIQSLRRDAYDGKDYIEGLSGFSEKREPSFRGL
jgi:methylmalonyl-CoA decarboxylase